MKSKILYIIILFLLISCGRFQDVKTMKKTTIQFEDPHRKYNPIIQGATLNMSYKLTNTGKKPLVISEVQTSCNCVVSKRTTKVIRPGDYGYINLKFDSKKNVGFVKQHITLIANIDSTLQKTISFETNVIPDSHYRKDYEEMYFNDREINNFAKNYIAVKN